ncbi:MAG: radical SAM protein [Candidatus Woesearchaeota archaeon]
MIKQINFLFYGINYLIKTKILKKKIPFNGAIIINDLCNLNCKHCNVSSKKGNNIPYEQIKKDMEKLYLKGIRFLEITGGEPFLYKYNEKNIEDIIKLAKQIGFYKILLCTNGTIPINTLADYVWVSLDGNKKTHNSIRGNTFDKILNNIKKSKHKKIFINFTISQLNYKDFGIYVKDILFRKKIKGILFHFFIPYINSSNIEIYEELKNNIIKEIFILKKKYGKKICNTKSALNYLKNGNWQKPVWGSLIIYNGKISSCCCRSEIVNSNICNCCLSTPAVETYNVQNINFRSLLEILRNFS